MPGAIVFPPVTAAFRDWPGPTFLTGPNGSRYLYSMRVLWDALGDAMTYAVLARYPNTCPPDAFSWIGQDRQIDIGFQESSTSYQARLIQWLDLWGYAGLPTSILLAVLSYVTPATPKVLTIDNTGNWHTYASGSVPFPPAAPLPTPPVLTTAPGNWRWDSLVDPFGYVWQWWRMWVILFSISGSPWAAPTSTWQHLTGSLTVTIVSDPVYGTVYQGNGTPNTQSTDFNWDGGASGAFTVVTVSDPYYGSCYQGRGGPQVTYTTPAWDWAGTVQQAQSLVQQCAKWKRAGCWIPNVIVSYDSTMFDSTQAFGSAKLPDGNWGHWGKIVSDATYGTFYAASRPASSTCSILDGAPITLE